jgi:hypothetical protein
MYETAKNAEIAKEYYCVLFALLGVLRVLAVQSG